MAGVYQLRLYDPFGEALAEIDDGFTLDYTLAVNNFGPLHCSLPPEHEGLIYAGGEPRRDLRFEVWRRVAGTLLPFALEGEAQWLLRGAELDEMSGLIACRALSLPHLLRRRIVPYYADEAETQKTDAADNLLKAVVRENLGASASDLNGDTSRVINAAYFQVQADAGAAPSLSKGFAYRRILEVFQELALASAQAGTYLAFDVVRVTPALLEFRTYTGQRGQDLRSGEPEMLLGAEYGNVADAVQDDDYSEEVSYAYAGGQGIEAARTVAVASDAARIAASPFNRCEAFEDSRMTTAAGAVQDDADARLRAGRPKRLYTGKLIETASTIYGLHYRWGDRVNVRTRNAVVDCRLDVVSVSMREERETVTAVLRGEVA